MIKDINITISEDPEIRYLEEKKIFNTIYTACNEELKTKKLKEFYKTTDEWIKNVIKLWLIWLSILAFVTVCFYIIKHIYIS